MFERLGGAKQIVQSHLDDVMRDLTGAEQEICARIFRYLVTPKGAKIAHETADLVAFAERPVERVAPLLEKLNGKRVLRRISPPERYEIFHDVLAPAILDWRARYVKDKEKAEAEKQAEEQRRVARRFLFLSMGLALLSIVAVLFGTYALNQKKMAAKLKRQADELTVLAARLRQEGADLKAEGLRLKAEADQERRNAIEFANAADLAKKKAVGERNREREARVALAHQLAGAAVDSLG